MWGGARPGAGRKKTGAAGVAHRQRDALASRFPVHVTLKLRRGLPRLRCRVAYRVLCGAFDRGKNRAGRLVDGVFRLVHYSVQNDHLHLIVEAKDRLSLTRGIQGLAIRIARALNRLWERRGRVFADRYHDRILRSPRQVRNTLRYVLNNAWKHLRRPPNGPDRYSSGPWFDGWRRDVPRVVPRRPFGPIAAARTWLLTLGWRRHGRLPVGLVGP